MIKKVAAIVILVVTIAFFFSCNPEKKLAKQVTKSKVLVLEHPDKFVDFFKQTFPSPVQGITPGKTVYKTDTLWLAAHDEDSITFAIADGVDLSKHDTLWRTRTRERIVNNNTLRVDTFWKTDPANKVDIEKLKDIASGAVKSKDQFEDKFNWWKRLAWILIIADIVFIAGLIIRRLI